MPYPTSRAVRRVAFVAVAWTTFAAIRIMLSLVASRTIQIDAMSVMFGLSMAAGWTLLTFAIAAWVRLIDRAHWPPIASFAAHVTGVAAVCVLDAILRRETIVIIGAPLTVPFYATSFYYADLNIVAYLAVLMVTRAFDLQELLAVQARKQLGLRAQLAQARLDYLEAQLQPHFLFNSLGTVAELAHEAPIAAARMLRQLASLLRFAVSEQGHAVTLRDELDALEPYLDIQRMRFSDWLTITYDVAPETLSAMVPRLTLQPLVENAIRHGLAGRTEHGLIRIVAAQSSGRLRLAVEDDGVGLSATSSAEGYGIGLGNIRHRLAAAYHDNFRLDLKSPAQGGTIAEIDLPLHFNPTVVGYDEPVDGVTHVTGRLLQFFQQRPVVATVLAWAIWGLLWFQMSYGYMAMRHRLGDIRLSVMILDHVIAVVLWALLTPVIFAAARVFPVTRRSWILLHIPIACVCALAHVAVWQLLASQSDQLWSSSYVASMLWTVLLYAFLVGVAQYRQVAEWFRERDTATARLEAELAEARMSSAAVRFRPDVVLRTLEDLAGRVHLDPSRAESELARLADDMRLALE